MKSFTLNNAAEIIAKTTGWGEMKHVEGRFEAKYSIPTYQKSIDLLGYKDTVSFEDGIKNMWEWAKMQPYRKQYKWEIYEITDGLYSYWK